MPPEMLFDYLAVRLNGPKAAGRNLTLNVDFTDLKKPCGPTVENGVLNYPDTAQVGIGAAALLEQDAFRAGAVDGDVGQHRERLAAQLGGGTDTPAVVSVSGVKAHPGTFGLAGASISVGRNGGSGVSSPYKGRSRSPAAPSLGSPSTCRARRMRTWNPSSRWLSLRIDESSRVDDPATGVPGGMPGLGLRQDQRRRARSR